MTNRPIIILKGQKNSFSRLLEPKFTLTQLTEKMASVGYKMISSKKGGPIRERIRVIDNEMALTLNNIEILVSVDDKLRVGLSV